MLKLISSILHILLCIGIAFSEESIFYPRLFDSPPAIVVDKGLYVDELLMETALLEPPDGKVYHGACLMTYEEGTDPIGPYLSALNDSTIQPAVRGFFITIPGERGPDNSFKGLKKFFQSADSIGFIPEVSLFFMDKRGSTDSIIAVSNTHDWIIDSIITLSKYYGKRMFLRIGGEFNGAGPGWNGGGYHPYLYVTMFRKIVDMFESRGFRDTIAVNWCYEPDAPNDFDSVDSRGARWYPGDRYVDWFGLDVFDPDHFDQSLPDYTGRSITKKGKSERFLAMAREKGKPVFMSETSAKGMNISSDEQDGINDWNNWFAKFWEFIAVHKEIKGFNYINANWPVSAYPDWGDSRIQNSSYVTQKYREEMKKPKYIHLINKRPLSLPARVIQISPESQSSITEDSVTLLWHSSSPEVTNYNLNVYLNNDLILSDTTLTDTSYTLGGLIPDREYAWDVQAKNYVGWGQSSYLWTFRIQGTSVGRYTNPGDVITISPNPASNYIEISLDRWTPSARWSPSEIKIYNSLGECVLTPALSEGEGAKIDISGLRPGVYFLRVGDEVKKFIRAL